MQDDRPEQRWLSGLALPVSAGLHLAILALLIFGLPHALLKPESDQAITVDLVPPPEAPPKPEPPAAQAEDEKPQQEKNAIHPAPQGPIPRLKPVFQYGEKDAGPRKSLEGNSATEESAAPDPQHAPDEQATPERDKPEQDKPGAPDLEAELALPDAAATPSPRPAAAARAQSATRLKQAKKLFSTSATGDALATTAMGGLPRSARGGTLCVTELREQLLRTSPPYFPDLLPSYPLGAGTVIDVASAAFRVGGQWRNLSYRCEVDADATKVISFAFRVGDPVPRSEWERRGFPLR